MALFFTIRVAAQSQSPGNDEEDLSVVLDVLLPFARSDEIAIPSQYVINDADGFLAIAGQEQARAIGDATLTAWLVVPAATVTVSTSDRENVDALFRDHDGLERGIADALPSTLELMGGERVGINKDSLQLLDFSDAIEAVLSLRATWTLREQNATASYHLAVLPPILSADAMAKGLSFFFSMLPFPAPGPVSSLAADGGEGDALFLGEPEIESVVPLACIPNARDAVAYNRSDSCVPDMCLPGFYTEPDERCTPCPLDAFNPEYGATACAPCPPGFTTRGLFGQVCCIACPSNSTVGGDGRCVPCPPNSMTLRATGSVQCDCVPGYAPDAQGRWCSPCPLGLYKADAGNARCSACPLFYTTLDGANGATVCDVCTPGAYVSSSGCLPCAHGTYSTGFAEAGCLSCPSGAFAAAPGLSSCTQCTQGTYQSMPGSTACAECPAYRTPSRDGTGCVCAPGAALDYLGATCAPCFPGFYKPLSDDYQTRCAMCPPFSTSAGYGSTVCLLCDRGAIRRLDGEGGCSLCAPGTFNAQIEATACGACAPGTYTVDAGRAACDPCPPNTFMTSAGATQCTPCQPFSASTVEGRAAPCDCIAGWTFDQQQAVCTLCPAGGATRADGTCVLCPAGTYAGDIGEGIQCLPCKLGTFSPLPGWTTCLQCPPYQTTGTRGASACVCAPGTIQDNRLLTCLPCPFGHFYRAAGVNGTSAPCGPCPPGHYSDALMSTACTGCPPGTANPWSGSSACLVCTEMVSADRTACQCPEGTYNHTSNSTVAWACRRCSSACPLPRQYIAQPCAPDTDIRCANCSDEAEACPLGTYRLSNCTQNADAVCWRCRDGCMQGEYVSAPCTPWHDLRCSPCTAACPPGTQQTAACALDSDVQCAPCPPGTAGPSCEPCPPGTVTPTAASECAECPAYSNPERTECVDACPPGAFPSAPRACSLCPDGTFSDDGLICTVCFAGACSKLVGSSSTCPR